ncbi:phospholipase D family protein [Marinobacter litoralis]|uniref:phospholipase D family protein n=1 Tax=Marinobacter litoralis TaxID=187981 RepID=UPI0018ED29D8|nr:phospholipase D family protein [Marinobacter litoralis]MBJ6139023.1 phospholipase D family protein [Marinobacter litoralis]
MTMKLVASLLLFAFIGMGVWHSYKPLPEGIRFTGNPAPLMSPRLLTDTTRHFPSGETKLDHEIFDEALGLIAQAEHFILIDMFLYNSTGSEDSELRPLAQQLTDALIEKKHATPDIDIVVISDPLNTFYGGNRSPEFDALKEAGIEVIITRLEPLRDSNPTWSALWRVCCQWLGNNPDGGWLPNALGNEKTTLRSYLALPNFKANHRKILVADAGDQFSALVSSANPHDGSSRHSNIGLTFSGPAVKDVIESERAVAHMSGASTQTLDRWLNELATTPQAQPEKEGIIKVLTESAIRDQALDMIKRSRQGEAIDIAMFYFSHRPIIEALKAAQQRGVRLRLLLDANKDAFGHEKNGIPNRPVGHELYQAGIPVRWCNTQGEQCHSKLLIYSPGQGSQELLLGSANFTRRNLDDLNLESNVWLKTANDHPVATKAAAFFDEQWQREHPSHLPLSLPYAEWADDSRLKYWQYRFMEATGLSTF